MIELQDIYDAHKRIRDYALWTPVMTSSTIDKLIDCKVFFKCENFQRVGAFKFRGALNTISQLTDDERKRGVIAHSSGNHAQALALAASLLHIKATIVMPKNSPKVKVDATCGYGADVVFCENSIESRVKVANELIERYNYVLIHPYNDERIIAGAGTTALELIEEVRVIDYMFAPVGGGGLLSGTSIATKGLCSDSKVIGVEPSNADDAFRSFRDGKIYPSINPNTIADGLRTQLGDLTFPIIKEYVDSIVTVTEEEIVEAMKLLWERMKIVVEPSGAVSLAGVIKMRDELQDKRLGVIISGGNIDLTEFFSRYL
ncbi:MAG: pyridoxal-phosphate dependent enzyme [Candidatus Thorarchaeota archaeon SMTZ1-45]|nr:MAG: serine dehydratase [Candidatus Thorarchaeota archaeon SMTZ1-45]